MNLKPGRKATLIAAGIGVAVLLGWLVTSQGPLAPAKVTVAKVEQGPLVASTFGTAAFLGSPAGRAPTRRISASGCSTRPSPASPPTGSRPRACAASLCKPASRLRWRRRKPSS